MAAAVVQTAAIYFLLIAKEPFLIVNYYTKIKF